MTVIWTGDHPQTQVLQDDKGGLRFRYVPIYHDKECLCEFTLFSEVGRLYQKWFAGFLADHRLADKPLTYDEAPYLADRLDQPIPMSVFKPDEWPNLQEAAKVLQAYADEHWPDLGIKIKLEVKAHLFRLEVDVQKRETTTIFAVDKDRLMSLPTNARQWAINRITAAVALLGPLDD
jgi:hypothetical protein